MGRPKADEEEQELEGTTQHALAQALIQAQSAQAQAQAHVSELLALLAAAPPRAPDTSTPALSSPHGAKQGHSHAKFANERVDIEAHYDADTMALTL